MNPVTRSWIIAISYVGFIYATLSIVRIPTDFLRSHGILNLSLIFLFAVCIAISFWLLFKLRGITPVRLLVFTLIFITYYLVARSLPYPEERIHFIEYGLVGIFFAKAFRHHLKKPTFIYLSALFLGSLAGWIDEIIQGWLPSRHYDIRDIYLNIFSVALGLILFMIYPSKSSPTHQPAHSPR